MKEYIIRSENEFLFSTNNQDYLLNRYNSYTMQVDENEQANPIKFYPLFNSPKSLPFCYRLTDTLSNVKKIELADVTLLEILPYEISTFDDVFSQQSLSYNGSFVNTCVTKNNLFINYNDNSVSIKNLCHQNYQFKISSNKLIATSPSSIAIVDLDSGRYTIDSFEKINKSSEKIEILQQINDFSGHLRVKSFNFDKSQKSVTEELYYQNNRPIICTNPKLIPIIVLDLIKLGDFALAKQYISNTINLNEHQLKDFFGEYDSYEIYDGDYFLIKDNFAYKKLNFIINNKSIVDIIDTNLY